MTLATGAVTLLSQGNEAGYVLLAIAVLAPADSTDAAADDASTEGSVATD